MSFWRTEPVSRRHYAPARPCSVAALGFSPMLLIRTR